MASGTDANSSGNFSGIGASASGPGTQSRILILDFGAQYSQLIARRVRESEVYCELVPADISLERIQQFAPTGVILSGGPSSVLDDDAPDMDLGVLERRFLSMNLSTHRLLCKYQY